MIAVGRWLRRSGLTRGGTGDSAVPLEAVLWRWFGGAVLVVCTLATFGTQPHPRLHGRGLVVLVAYLTLVGVAVGAHPGRAIAKRQRVLTLIGVIAAAGVLGSVQPNGVWIIGPYYVAIVGAMKLDRRTGWLLLGATLAPFVAGYLVKGQAGGALTFVFAIFPWFLAMRLLHHASDQRDELRASRAAEASAAAAAERGRLAREMHDVLAHSLSALALQLETTRVLARSRGVDEDVAVALDRAHHLAASGLDEARRAIAAERGDVLPGPERIGALGDAFAEQSGLPVAVAVHGDPRELSPEARLAVYRTAQEALTNVRRHATAERVEMTLAYLPDAVTLTVEDRAFNGGAPPVTAGATGGYGLTGMRERAELLGGELRAAPTDHGFRVELRLPNADR
jgi:signal transduction histidine kinase